MKSFSNENKRRTFSRLWPGYCLFWLCKRNTTHKIPKTSAVYWVAWFVESGVYRTPIKLQKNESGNCSIWNKFYIKDVYLNKYNIKIVNMSCDLQYVAWFFVNSLGIKNGKQLMKRNSRIIANWVLNRVKNKNVTMLHNSK
jgi:hypothetical protein